MLQAFGTVNQRDSQAMRVDSQAMKAVAIMTMLFLPVTAVSGIYGSAFFTFDSGTRGVVMANGFERFWVITLPLTLAIFAVYGVWHLIRVGNGPTAVRGWVSHYLKLKG